MERPTCKRESLMNAEKEENEEKLTASLASLASAQEVGLPKQRKEFRRRWRKEFRRRRRNKQRERGEERGEDGRDHSTTKNREGDKKKHDAK